MAAAPTVSSVTVTTSSAKVVFDQAMNQSSATADASVTNLSNFSLSWGAGSVLYPFHSDYGHFVNYVSAGTEGVATIFGLGLTAAESYSLTVSQNVKNASAEAMAADSVKTGTVAVSTDPLINKIENTTGNAATNDCYGYPCGKVGEQIKISGLRFNTASGGVQVIGLGSTQTVSAASGGVINMTIPNDSSLGNNTLKIKNLNNNTFSNLKYFGIYRDSGATNCGVVKGKLTDSGASVGTDQNDVPVRLETWGSEYGDTKSHNNGYYAVVAYSDSSCQTGSYDVFFSTPAGASEAAPTEVGSQTVTAGSVTDAGTKAFNTANVTGYVYGPSGSVGAVGVRATVHNDYWSTIQRAITDNSGFFRAYVPTSSAANYYWIEARPSTYYAETNNYMRAETSMITIAQSSSALNQTVRFRALNVQGTVKTPTSATCSDSNLNPYPDEAVRYARVCLHTQDWSVDVCESANASGVFQLGVPAGTNYILDVEPQWGDDKYGGYSMKSYSGLTILASLTNLDTLISGGPRLGYPNVFGRALAGGSAADSIMVDLSKGGFWRSNRTNSEGKFRFSVPESGTYHLHIDSYGTYSEYDADVVISSAEVSTGKNLGDISLPSPNVSGKVYGPAGTADAATVYENVEAELCPYMMPGQCYHSRTNASGAFGVYVPNGSWQLSLRLGPGFTWAAPSAVIVTISGAVVTGVDGDTTDADEPLGSDRSLTLRLTDPTTDGLTGYVYKPAADTGQRAQLGLRALGSMGMSTWAESDATTGKFAFGGVSAGTYELEIMPDWDSAYSRAMYTITVASDGTVSSTDTGFTAVSKRNIIVRFKTPNITGTLYTPKYSSGYADLGIDQTEFDQPIQWGWVNMHQAGPMMGPGEWYGTNTDASGDFRLGGVKAGSYIIEYSAGWESKFSMVSEAITISAAVAAGTESINLNATSSKKDTSTNAPSGAVRVGLPQLRGTVKDPNGNVVSNVWIMVFDDTHMTHQGSNADSNGKFSIGGLSDGTYNIEVNMPWGQGLVAPSGLSVVVSSDVGVVKKNGVTQAGNIISLAYPTKTITGTVKKSGTAVASARVEAHKNMGGGFVETRTNSSGVYTLKVSGGDWWVEVWPDWGSDIDWVYSKPPVNVSFSNDTSTESETVNFTVQATNAYITGYVKQPNGTAVSNCWVDICQDMGMCNGRSTDSNGRFSVRVVAGTYRVSAFPPSDLMQTFGAPDETIVTVAENETVDAGTLTLKTRDATIKGRVQDEAGNAIQNVNINVWQFGQPGWAMDFTDTKGEFSVAVSAGKWGVMVMPMSSQHVYQGAPLIVEVLAGETKENNNFVLKLANATIKGKVHIGSATGDVATDVFGGAWIKDVSAGGFGQMLDFGGPMEDMMGKSGMIAEGGMDTTTGTGMPMGGGMEKGGMGAGLFNGAFELKVPAGTYEVGIGMPPGSAYTLYQTATVTIAADATETVDLVVKQNDATISGYFYLDANSDDSYDSGEEVTGIRAMVHADRPEGGWQMSESNYSTGAYSLSVSEGTWYVDAFIDFFMAMEWGGAAAGSKYMVVAPDQSVIVTSGSSTTLNFEVKKLDATVTGTVTGPGGSPMKGVWVFPDLGSADMVTEFKGPGIGGLGTFTNASGVYSLAVAGGTYKIRAGIPIFDTRNLLNPDPVVVTIASGATSTGNDLQFGLSNATISGNVTLSGSKQKSYIRAWSAAGKGSGVEATDGTYTLYVNQGETWYIEAAAEVSGTLYESATTTVTTVSGTSSYTQNLALVSTNVTMPDPKTASFDSTQAKTIMLDDGLTVECPAGSIKTSGTVTVSVAPTVDMMADGDNKLVGYGYDFVAKDSDGKEIKDFAQNVTIVMPYDEDAVAAAGYAEESLTPRYYEETTGIIKEYDTVIRDTENNKLRIMTDHFSLGGPTGGGDVPTAPSGLSAAGDSNSQISLSWTDNSTNETGFKVYRDGSLLTTTAADATSFNDTGLSAGTSYSYYVKATNAEGDSAASNTASATTTSGGVIILPAMAGDGVPPAPVEEAVEEAVEEEEVIAPAPVEGEEEIEIEITIPTLEKPVSEMSIGELKAKIAEFMTAIQQLQVLLAQLAEVPGIPADYKFEKTLKAGQISEDVKYLQIFLNSDPDTKLADSGVGSPGKETNYFGPLTKQAVIKFQQKYASDVLSPWGLTSGTGLVGKTTRAKLNELLGR